MPWLCVTSLKLYVTVNASGFVVSVAVDKKARSCPVNDDGSDDHGRSDGVPTEISNGSDEESTEISNRADGNRGTRAYSGIRRSRGGSKGDYGSNHTGSRDTGNGRDIRSSRQRSSRNRRNRSSLRPLPRAIAEGRDFA